LPPTRYLVRVDAEGTLHGRVGLIDPTNGGLIPAPNSVVRFLRGGNVIAEARSGPQGEFAVAGLEPGIYAVAARGPGGFATLSILVAPYDPAASEPYTLLEIALVPPADLAAIEALAGEFPGGPGGGFGGGYGGFGGGFGGGGGGGGFGDLGALAGLAGLAGLAAAAQDDGGGDFSALSPPASPFQIPAF
jgi:hypothetical protein